MIQLINLLLEDIFLETVEVLWGNMYGTFEKMTVFEWEKINLTIISGTEVIIE